MSTHELVDFIADSPVLEVVKYTPGRAAVGTPTKIVLEGVDGCGKTTTADKLFTLKIARPVILVHAHAGKPWFDSWQAAIDTLIVKNKTTDMIFDRGWACEYVYAKFFGNRPPPLKDVLALDRLAKGHCTTYTMSQRERISTYYNRLDDIDKEQFTTRDLKIFQRRYNRIWKQRSKLTAI